MHVDEVNPWNRSTVMNALKSASAIEIRERPPQRCRFISKQVADVDRKEPSRTINHIVLNGNR
jgi:hypothetical protein